MSDKRSECRILCADLIEVRWEDVAGRPQCSRATLEDISPSGVCLQFETEVPAGTKLRVISGKTELHGTVRHCQYLDIGYFAGVQLDAGVKWSVSRFKPRYMLDPRTLLPLAPAAAPGSIAT